jgi:hypothetical protein
METTGTSSSDARITLAEAAKSVPGNPHTSAVWRWARKGVKARSGERIRLRHTRVGGRVFTTRAWIDEFGERLAQADAEYFDAKADAADCLPPRDERYGPPSRQRARRTERAKDADRRAEQIEQELREEGL